MEKEIIRKVFIDHSVSKTTKRSIQVSEVNESVSKIAKLFKSKEKVIKVIKQSLVEANERMVNATIMTTEAIEENENTLERIKALESFLCGTADDENDRRAESTKSLNTLVESLHRLNEAKLQQTQLVKGQIIETLLVHHLITLSANTAEAVNATFSKLKALHIKQESILEKKKGHLESINSARLSSKKALAKAVDNKDLQEGRAHREHEAQEYLLRENERLYANLGAAQLKTQEREEIILTIATARDRLGERKTALENSRRVLSSLKEETEGVKKELVRLDDARRVSEGTIASKREEEAGVSTSLEEFHRERARVHGAVSEAKASLHEVQAEGRRQDSAYQELLEALHSANLDQKALLEEQSLQIHQLQLEQAGLKAAQEVAMNKLSQTMQQLAELERGKSLVDAEFDASLRSKEDLLNTVYGQEALLKELAGQRERLHASVASFRVERLQALEARSTEALKAIRDRQHNAERELSGLDEELSGLHAYESKVGPIPSMDSLSAAAQARFLPRFSQRLALRVQEQTREFQTQENKKNAVLQDLRDSKRLHLQEEHRNKVVLQWKRKLDEVNARIQRFSAKSAQSRLNKREEDNNKCEKKDKKRSTRPQRKDVPSSRYGKGDLVAKPAPVLRQPSPTLPRSGGLDDDFSSPRSFIASRKSAASSRHAKLAKSANAKGDDNIEDCSDDDTPTSKVTFPKLPSRGKEALTTDGLGDWFQDW